MRLSCPIGFDNWTDFGGEFCYFIATTEFVSWFEAYYRCKAKGKANGIFLYFFVFYLCF